MPSDHSTKNYYQLLNLERNATKEEIKAAYKSIALVYHPDSNFFDEILDGVAGKKQAKENEEFFKLLTAAYHTLVNADSRSQYDLTLAPELPGWDHKQNTQHSASSYSKKTNGTLQKTAPSAAFGVFGSVAEEEYDEYDDDHTMTNTQLRTHNRGGFFSRLFSLFQG